MNWCVLLLQALLTSDTEEDEDAEDAGEGEIVPQVHYAGGPLRPSWVSV